MIRFALKSAFWLVLAFTIMPHFLPAESKNETHQKVAAPVPAKTEPDEIEQLLAHGKSAMEIGKFCLDNPSLCEQGQSYLASSAQQLLTNSGAILDYLSAQFGTRQSPAAPPAATPAKVQQKFIPVPTPRESALQHSSSAASR
ncbi:hypothetical protein DKP76_00220 [Falsochrobactrum shanghaiense]|uniref:DUF5330 domain-containing protein n=1 Tax=Falsochrobactrum shanghaiense TaxID=2201899 RepID=A0A316JEK1_9HYPH|nr:hypothetical protein [Falsochrobactrum shanghaiense]PWL19045.1 hypothetical protein DKP76_00220 [Falsochrobactrum shanghaiense]